ncbi:MULTISPECIES: hypothetical protein [unclassified Enterococcus]|uniref:hypothetical protein n=1 Tax=unclassified Enterococcus TaxID=2608891 RepID=UPI001A9AB19A|nr:hypothetical protein [Enterococcus sp. DIV1271a]MBO1301085.1 hypothetical protein [Enterococcus sp. DIV1271a]
MQSMRRLGAMLLILFFGIIIGNYGLQTALLIFLPSFVLWFVMWDEKKYRQTERKRRYEENFYQQGTPYHFK